MRYGQLYFYDFDVIFQFLLCESGICSSLFWSVVNSSVLHECQQGRGAHLGVRIVPSSPHPTLFSCCSLTVDEVSVLRLSGYGPSGEHCRYCKPSTFFAAWPFTIISYSSLPLKCDFSLFIGTFWKEQKNTQFNRKVVLKMCLQCTPFLSFCWVLPFLQHHFGFGLWRAVLKWGLLFLLLKNSAGEGVLLGCGIKWQNKRS